MSPHHGSRSHRGIVVRRLLGHEGSVANVVGLMEPAGIAGELGVPALLYLKQAKIAVSFEMCDDDASECKLFGLFDSAPSTFTWST